MCSKGLAASVWLDDATVTGTLAGLRVVDLSRVLAGPLCTQMLSDHGADVIKIESALGDESRQLGPPFDAQGNAAYFTAINRGKRSMTLNLASEDDREMLMLLLEQADVLVENFVPGTMKKWQLDYETDLKDRFPKLIYCTISGFGDSGPLGGLPGYDAVLQAMCGLMSINGSPETGPTRIGIPLVDHLTGYTALSGILMALYARERSGKGQRVEAVLFDAALSLLVPQAANWMQSGVSPTRMGSGHPNIAPYDCFETSDGPMFLGVVNDSQFFKLCTYINRPDLVNHPDYATNAARSQNRVALRAEIEPVFLAESRDALCAGLMRQGVPAGPVNTVPEALDLAHTRHRQMIVDEPAYRGLGIPIKLSSSTTKVGLNPPTLGEHNEQIKHILQQSLHSEQDT
ncbi:CoA transferase [Allopusillimonas ginsengisoli]|nr:CoA transferase [Allopusillimonas ginsengisoli]